MALIESMRRNGPMGVLGTRGDIQQIMAKMKKMEDKRQEVYLRLLDRRGQKVALTEEGGGHALVSFPQALIRMPNTLKYKPIDEWSKYEEIWQNVTHFPWYLNDAKCKHFSISFAPPHSLEPLGLVSYPSSGNTWLRYLVEGATGYFTGSMYNDLMLGTKGLYGEVVPWDSGMTVAIKSHGHTTGQGVEQPRELQVNYNNFEEFDKRAILLIRNPFRAIIGHRHLDSGGHTGFADEDQFIGEDWDHFVRVKIASWENLYLDWLHEAESEDIHVIHFETLKQDLVSSLRALVQFMELEVDEGRLKCTWRNNEGNFHRKKAGGSLAAKENPFTPEHTILIRDSIHRVNQALFEKKKPEMPLDQYEFYQM